MLGGPTPNLSSSLDVACPPDPLVMKLVVSTPNQGLLHTMFKTA